MLSLARRTATTLCIGVSIFMCCGNVTGILAHGIEEGLAESCQAPPRDISDC
ncbi:MAG: hypothetical protein ACM3ML_20030 [Micromonosporaceae bacterium]